MPRLKKAQVQLLERLVKAGVQSPASAIIGAACYDQKRLSPTFYGVPKVGEVEARRLVDQWLGENPPRTGYPAATEESVSELIALVFG